MDLGADVGQVLPYLTAVIGAYGTAVIERVRDDAAQAGADATVGVGRRVLRRLLGHREAGSEQATETESTAAAGIESAVRDVAQRPGDAAAQMMLQAHVMTLLRDDPQLRRDLLGLLPEGGIGNVTASGPGAVAAGGSITGPFTTGANSPIQR